MWVLLEFRYNRTRDLYRVERTIFQDYPVALAALRARSNKGAELLALVRDQPQEKTWK